MSDYLICDFCGKFGGSLYDDGDACICGGKVRDVFFYKSDRDRWKERCEAAENVIFCADGYCTTDDYYNAFGVWDAIKSEMEADQ